MLAGARGEPARCGDGDYAVEPAVSYHGPAERGASRGARAAGAGSGRRWGAVVEENAGGRFVLRLYFY